MVKKKEKPWLRIIGDVHGHIDRYIPIAQAATYSLQVGDMGFDYSGLKVLDPKTHRVLAGNHDNYEQDQEGNFYNQTPHFLGDAGSLTIPNFPKIFFVRGGKSIDQSARFPGVNWWRQEELSYSQGVDILEIVKKVKPDFVVTHECPSSLLSDVSKNKMYIRPSSTAELLQQMLEIHRPKIWIFGHHHISFYKQVEGTKFYCIPELGYLDFKANEVF